MNRKMLGFWIFVLAAQYPIFANGADRKLAPAPPGIDPIDQTHLMRHVRRVLTHALRQEQSEASIYVPPSLQPISCRVSVTIRRAGKLIATADSDEKPIMEACSQAAQNALAIARRLTGFSADDLPESTLELELIGPRERLGDGKDDPALLAVKFEPAIDGISAIVQGNELLIRPSQLISMESYCLVDEELKHRCDRHERALVSLREKLGLDRQPPNHEPQKIVISRFRSRHWVEPTPGADAIELTGGMTVVKNEDVTVPQLAAIIEDLARFIRYRQVSDGLFSYEFLPGRDMYWPQEQNWVRQTATAWALAAHASTSRDQDSTKAVVKALDAFKKMVKPFEGEAHAGFLATPDDRHPLGATALLALACMDAPDKRKYADLNAELLNAIAAMQREDGSFRTQFPPAQSDESNQDYFPGEALLAVARHYVKTRDPKWRAVCDRALPFYLKYWRKSRPPMFVPWQVQAWGQLARTTQLKKYADFVFEMSDFIVEKQLDIPDPPLNIYDGAFDVHGTGRGGISSTVYVEGLIEAARTAKTFGDETRLKRYMTAIRHACRFIVQLRFRPEECYYVRSPRDVLGGMRNTPADPTLRIDHVQHALAALRGAVELWHLDSRPSEPRP